MPKDGVRKRGAAKRTATARGTKKPAKLRKPSDASKSAAAHKAADEFARDLVVRGEAARKKKGKLPPGATHEIVGTEKDGTPKLRRRRFSLA